MKSSIKNNSTFLYYYYSKRSIDKSAREQCPCPGRKTSTFENKKQHVGKRKSAKIFRPIDFSHVVTNVMSEQHELIHLNAKKGT